MEAVTYKTTGKQLSLFGRAIAGDTTVDFCKMNETAILCGYAVDATLCNTEVYEWLLTQKVDYNATFYKRWNDVISKNRFELFIDQIIHYISTYGTNHQGEPYFPNNFSTRAYPEITDVKVIFPITEEELKDKCLGMLYSGIALKEQTITDLLEILDELNTDIEIDKVRNKEAKMRLCVLRNLLPSSPEEMVRYLVYKLTDSTMVIKDRKTIQTIKSSHKDISADVERFGIEKLSSVFYRYKPLFLAMRTTHNNKVSINKLRRLAKTHHKPYQAGFFEKILQDPSLLDRLPEMVENLNNYKKVALLQTINVRRKELQIRPFLVRNQKLYMKEESSKYYEYYDTIYSIIYQSLVQSLSKKACKVKISTTMELALPTSEKSFIGNLPLGTVFHLDKEHSIVGINWKDSEGARDLDLKYIDVNGRQIGWNADYYDENQKIIYSGDVTSPNPEATELLYAEKGFTPAVIKVNLYSGEKESKFKFFLAKEDVSQKATKEYGYYGRGDLYDYMVQPDSIIFQTDLTMMSGEMILGVLTEDKFTVANFRTSDKRVAGESITNQYAQYSLDIQDTYLSLKKVLEDAGFSFVMEEYDMDLSKPDKSILINLLS